MTPENPKREEALHANTHEPAPEHISSDEGRDIDATRRITRKAREQDLAGEAEGSEAPPKGGFLAELRTAYQRFRDDRKSAGTRQSKDDGPAGTTSRAAKSQDRSKGLLVLAVIGVAMLFAVIGLLSHSSNKSGAERKEPNLGRPNLGRGESVAKPNGGSITPLQSVDTSTERQDTSDQVSAEDVDRTRRPHPAEPVKPVKTLADVPPMADPALEAYRRQVGAAPLPVPSAAVPVAPVPAAAASQGREVANPLNRSSLVFVSNSRTYQTTARTPALSEALLDQRDNRPLLPNGSRLVARLQAAVTTAVKTPVVAAIEYNYERDGEILIPAGTKAFGELQQANKTGVVSLRFNRLEMAHGTIQEINGTAISLSYGPLKGSITGNTVAKRILVRSLAGIGATAAFLVGGPGGLSGASGGLDNSILLRERIASNAGLAGDQEVSNLAVNQQLVVTVPANTRFFIVLQEDDKGSRGRSFKPSTSGTPTAPATPGVTQYASTGNSVLPTAQELRELIELKSEINRMYQQAATVQASVPGVDSSSADHTAAATAFPETQP